MLGYTYSAAGLMLYCVDALCCKQYVCWRMNKYFMLFQAVPLTLVRRKHQCGERAADRNQGGRISTA